MHRSRLDLYSEELFLFSKKVQFLFLFEFLLICLVGFELYKIALLVILVLFCIFFIRFFFENPLALLLIFLFSILAGAIEDLNFGSKNSQFSFVDFLFPLLILLYLVLFIFKRKYDFPDPFLFLKINFLLFILWGCFTLIIAPDLKLAIGYLRNYFAGFIVFVFSLAVLKDDRSIRRTLIAIIIWGLVLAFIELYIVLSLGGLSEGLMKIFFTKNLLATSWGKSNYLAAFFVFIIPLTIGYLLSVKNRATRFALIFALGVMFTAILITLSKGGILSLFLALIILFSKTVKIKTLAPIIVLVFLVIIVLIVNPMTSLVLEGFVKLDSNFSTMTRINFYKDAWNIFLENPITGIGLGNLGYYAKFKISASASAHNLFLGLLGEAGIIGALFFLLLLGKMFLILLKNYINEKEDNIKIFQWAGISAFIGVLAHSMMEPNFEGFQFGVIFWTVIPLFLKISNLSPSEKQNFFSRGNKL